MSEWQLSRPVVQSKSHESIWILLESKEIQFARLRLASNSTMPENSHDVHGFRRGPFFADQKIISA
ncbi:MAG: hypothetical protein OJF51_000218 [Nitrospira sp.]|jgi:hypothetical protein|nr:MAG: hypothetical protein OJF51_000218 [Nitrospira sp.]